MMLNLKKNTSMNDHCDFFQLTRNQTVWVTKFCGKTEHALMGA